MPKPTIPTEDDEQAALADYLDARGLLWCHVPNEVKLLGGAANRHSVLRKMRRLGVKTGVPDVLIFESTPTRHGTAIELKRIKSGRTSEAQKQWLRDFDRRNWHAFICNGATEAIRELERIYPR